MMTPLLLSLLSFLPLPPRDSTPVRDTFRVRPNDARVPLVGRWDLTEPSVPRASWQGSSAELAFEGTDLWVRLRVEGHREFFRVIVDGDDLGSRRFAADPGTEEYPLARELEDGPHRVLLVKETYAGTRTALLGFSGSGAGPRDLPPRTGRRIVFYGDSNLAGYSLGSEHNQGALRFQGCHFTYAGVTARAFDAAYQNISVSGATLADLESFYALWDRRDPAARWDFERTPADVVVLNMAANDLGAGRETITRRFLHALELLRRAHPTSWIVLFNARGWDYDEPAGYTEDVVERAGDARVRALTFPWVFETWHGCESDHGGMARVLIEKIEELTGWHAREPALLDGFGAGDTFGNGGFEQQAPFGGFAWRYADDPGVARIRDPASAHGGRFFLRLEEGALVHQPKVLGRAERVRISLFARGASPAARAQVRVEFRDQKMGTAPLLTKTETLRPGTSWQPWSLELEVPDAQPHPAYQVRLTLTAPAGRVDFDDVSLRLR